MILYTMTVAYKISSTKHVLVSMTKCWEDHQTTDLKCSLMQFYVLYPAIKLALIFRHDSFLICVFHVEVTIKTEDYLVLFKSFAYLDVFEEH